MPLSTVLDAQRDFSAGELDADLKRRDDVPMMKAGARQMSDFRILNSGQIQQRSGRRFQFAAPAGSRTDEIEVAPGVIYRLVFGSDGSLSIVTSANALVVTQAGYPWNANTIWQIVWTQVKVSLQVTDAVICFNGMQPAVARYDGATPWTIGAFAFATGADGIRASPFLRLVAPGATITPSSGGGAGTIVTLVASAPVFLPAHVGTIFRFANSRMLITSVADTTHATATLLETMNPTQQLTVAARTGASVSPVFIVGQSVEGSVTNTVGVVVSVVGAAVTVQILDGQGGFSTADVLSGPTSSAAITAIANVAPQACAVWDEELISTARGWPSSCFNDRGRLGFCDIPAAVDAVMWSATDLPYFFSVGALPTDAMVEILAGKPHIYHVGPWFDEIVFASKGIWYIPIGSANTGLAPGTVEFIPITNEASSQVKPAFTSEGFLYANAGRTRINVIVGSGAAYSTKPYVTKDITQFHKHLFVGSPKGISISTGDGQAPERYVYVTDADGTLVVGRYEPGKDWIGWVPWKGTAVYSWVSALFGNIVFTTSYAGVGVVEQLDDTVYLDCVQGPGALPFTAVWIAMTKVTLMDGVNNLGLHQIDAAGHVVPLYPGEDFSSPTLVGGFAYTPTYEPFLPNAEPGTNQKQRTRRRRIQRVNVSVSNSTGFFWAKLYAGRQGALLPAPGSVIGGRRISAYNVGDDQTIAPPLREEKYSFRGPTGHTYDPRWALIKDTAGPLRILEIGQEAST